VRHKERDISVDEGDGSRVESGEDILGKGKAGEGAMKLVLGVGTVKRLKIRCACVERGG
jgi:hypothetical protein